ncbi:glycoside hydrolase family 1 protein [Plebeiibacterium sediminum]|uniref:Family 1 glycosylhydrolase n=1 Tax=Plebeiibacterium sediminum TaxID=2992112 RepID=A0AAE3SE00_9BACT|nr:family 1 glycosylhydrolase [Plebeiobacterium sediminum]MCW3785462.1 family 1 glycosylhydrolase [Plebeiobacterium sediminum]
MLKKKQFGSNFIWGTAMSAFQNEGWATADGKGESIWDKFTSGSKLIKNQDQIGNASNFYKDYNQDISLAASLNFNVFRFSISWSRIFPEGIGQINKKGVDFYHQVIDSCLNNGLTPWITLYHWDLPQKLEDRGGWTNRAIIDWFSNYVDFCTKEFGSKVKHWIVINEPMSFTGLGYYNAYHAPAKSGLNNFLKAAHHVTLCNAIGGRITRENVSDAQIGMALSCSNVKAVDKRSINKRAASRVEALLNRFFIEPALGLGYPSDHIPGLSLILKYFEEGDEELIKFDFDFIGLQYYFRVVTKFSLFPPVLFATEIPPKDRTKNLNAMNLEVHPKGLSKVLNFYNQYHGIKKIILTESGVCYPDQIINGEVNDTKRLRYHQKILKEILKAKKKGIPVDGYLIWTLVDNFEWREGFSPRFGLVHNNFNTQERIIKQSGYWFQEFLK